MRFLLLVELMGALRLTPSPFPPPPSQSSFLVLSPPSDDPYFEALDLHAWATNDLEYYSPFAVQTVEDPDDSTNGLLRFTLSNITQHDLYYQGAELSSWNKVCSSSRKGVVVRLV